MSEPKRRGRPPKKKWVIRCGEGQNYLTEIREAQSGHPKIYIYGSKDVKDAMRFVAAQVDKVIMKLDQIYNLESQILRAVRKE